MVVFAYEAAWRELGDAALDRELWPSARAAGGLPLRLHRRRDGPAAAERRPLGADGRPALVQRRRDLRRARGGGGDGGAPRAGARRRYHERRGTSSGRHRGAPLERASTAAISARAGSRARTSSARPPPAIFGRRAALSDPRGPQRRSRGRARRQLPPRAVLAVPRGRSRLAADARHDRGRRGELRSPTAASFVTRDDDYAGGQPVDHLDALARARRATDR